eukprot:TRINITY_DN13243_c0_g1_i1.p1 TRINITY_DN13243_c0_g1~~TRINITY_DN13243_c0_g1_i1.p1  ORF type:complete len:375 (-),score=68.10 TRINITY_DN13243_c0_g1_i1:53-1138(-)
MDIGWGRSLPRWAGELLDKYSSAGKLYGHGVCFSPLSSEFDERSQRWLENFKKEVKARRYRHITEHYGWMRAAGAQDGAPLPAPYTSTAVQIGQNRLQMLAAAAGKNVRIGLENLALAMNKTEAETHAAFLTDLIAPLEEQGCLLLDIHNLYCQIHNFDLDPQSLLAKYPLTKVVAIHISGGSFSYPACDPKKRPFRRDTHDGMVPDYVMNTLLPLALRLCVNVEVVVYERLGFTMRTADDVKVWQADFMKIENIVKQYKRPDRAFAVNDKLDNNNKNMPEGEEEAEEETEEMMVMPVEDEALRLYQEKLFTTLYDESDNDTILGLLLADPAISAFHDYIRSFDPRCLETASILVKKWGRW